MSGIQIATVAHLAADPGTYLPARDDKKAIATARVLVNSRERNAQGEWVDVTPTALELKAFGDNADRLGVCAKGVGVIFIGRIRTEHYRTEGGESRYRDVVYVDHLYPTRHSTRADT